MNSDKAYLLGLILGGGVWGNEEDIFKIKLPYRQWGSYLAAPERAGTISRDILSVVSPMFRHTYGLIVGFEAGQFEWTILCEGDTTDLVNDLNSYGIEAIGEMRMTADISKIVPALIDDNLKRRFIAGLADTIGSTAPSHRRFSDEIQIISFEIKGFNFSSVCSLCKLLYSINCYPDQILWNHPNFHTSKNPYYKKWTKGFKLRVQLDQYAQYGAFAFRSRAESARENLQLQQHSHQAVPCKQHNINVTPACVHPAELDERLPSEIRGGHYLHNKHVCAVLGCEHAPYDKLVDILNNCGTYINPFPILYKDHEDAINHAISHSPLMSSRNYSIYHIRVQSIYDALLDNPSKLLYGDDDVAGYPITEVAQAVAYTIANPTELNGARIRGNYSSLIKKHLHEQNNLEVEIHIPDLLTPLIIKGNGRGALVGARNPKVYARLANFDQENKYKLIVREITEEDLRNA